MALTSNCKNRLVAALCDQAAANEVITILNIGTVLSGTEAGYLDGVTAGTGLASKALVLSSGADLTLPEGADITLGTTTGTKIGTTILDKLGFFNATPIIQRASANQAAPVGTGVTQSSPYGFATAAQGDAVVTLVTELRAALVAFGLIKGAA